MAKLKEYNGHYCESEFEYAFIGFLEAEGWSYTSGNSISRKSKTDVLIEDDFKDSMHNINPELDKDEISQIFDNVRLVGAESDFATLHKVYGWMIDGVNFTPKGQTAKKISIIDFENPENTAREGIRRLKMFLSSIGMPLNFSQLGAKREDIPKLLDMLKADERKIGRFIKLTREDCKKIYEIAARD